MIATIVIVSLALAWLGYETDWMRKRLLAGYDSRQEFYEFIQDYYSEYDEYHRNQKAYESWLQKRYAAKHSTKPKWSDTQVDPRDEWMIVEDDLRARRQGEMLYQR